MSRNMRRIIILSLMLVAFMAFTVKGAGSGVTLTGPGTVRAGDTIQVNIVIGDVGRNAIEGTLAYDAGQVTLAGVTTAMSGWKVETNGNIIMAYDENMSNPTKAGSVVAVATFKVNAGVSTGANLKISLNNTSTAAGGTSYDIGTVSYSVSIARPLSGNNALSSLSVNGVTLSPAFGPDVTTYNLGEVEYEVSSLNIKAQAADGGARVSIAGNSLQVGNNRVVVNVTAENGSVRSYNLNVVRKQDPNYVMSSNANMSSIAVSSGVVSPGFSQDVTKYVVYLPYEYTGSPYEINGTPADGKAQGVRKASITALKEGTNEAVVECVAEDGTVKKYNITVVVMPKYQGAIPNIEGVEVNIEEPTTEEPVTEEPTTEEPTVEEPTTEQTTEEAGVEKEADNEKNGAPVWIVILVGVVSFVAGFVIKLIVTKKHHNI